MVARTRMCRTMVAITRGENFGGAAWQRPQLARKRCSPSRCRFSSCTAGAAVVAAGADVEAVASFAASLLLVPAKAARLKKIAPERMMVGIANFIFIIAPSLAATQALQSDKSCQRPRDWCLYSQ